MIQKKPLVIIGGATGVGKTSLSIELAKMINGEIISADSMQVYKGFDIGTAKIKEHEKQGIRHYLIDILPPNAEFNVFEFKSRAAEAIENIYSDQKIPIIVGGTGFYIQSVLYDIDFQDDDNDKSYRSYLEGLAEKEGFESTFKLLEEVDPDSASKIHPHNVKRVIRALEYFNKTGETISSHNERESNRLSPYNYAYFVLNRKREKIYKNINERVDKMISDGLVSEVETLLNSGIDPRMPAMQGIGYKEIIPYIEGREDINDAIDNIKLDTRHFAKRQITWFKREKESIWIEYEDHKDNNAILNHMMNILKKKGIINV